MRCDKRLNKKQENSFAEKEKIQIQREKKVIYRIYRIEISISKIANTGWLNAVQITWHVRKYIKTLFCSLNFDSNFFF